jgi:hypothetical protein
MIKQIISFVFLLFFSIPFLNATVIYVDSSHVSGTQNGLTWATAFSNFQAGINATNTGDSLWVAGGSYQPPTGGFFVMKEGVKIFGGFTNTMSLFATVTGKPIK